jgi:nucleotidyltransferase substrate binding protein (TIGR01987 family)
MPRNRWKTRFTSYVRSLDKLLEITDKISLGSLSEIERDSLIKRFELTFELAWNLLKDFLEDQGETQLFGSRNTFRSAFSRGLIQDGETWMDMVDSRVRSAHVYDEDSARDIAELIYKDYIRLFNQLKQTMQTQIGG